jgi:exodeoxyribonuclease III
MTLSIATWNINSVRLRLPIVLRVLEALKPDVLCLQEIKCLDDQFPAKDLARAGYRHQAVYGMKSYNGVAIISTRPLSAITRHVFCGRTDARILSAEVDGVSIENFYVPAGGDIPDPVANEKFAHKLAFMNEFEAWAASRDHGQPRVLVGDLNIAPLETDVWSHNELLDVVSHTPVEVEALQRVQNSGRYTDVMREIIPASERLYTWWSYRAADWRASNRGRRLDHVWASPALSGTWRDLTVLDDARSFERPSDHVPVMVRFEI